MRTSVYKFSYEVGLRSGLVHPGLYPFFIYKIINGCRKFFDQHLNLDIITCFRSKNPILCVHLCYYPISVTSCDILIFNFIDLIRLIVQYVKILIYQTILEKKINFNLWTYVFESLIN